jgi:hypothetical protein
MIGDLLELSENAKRAIRNGSVKVRVLRSGIYQQITFAVKRESMGDMNYVELFTERIIDVSELLKVANSIGLPVQAPNAKVFPAGTAAADFQVT